MSQLTEQVRWPRMTTAATDHRQATAERNVEAILDAAEGLLRRRAQPTIAAVAKESGVSRVTVYSHFATRADLVEAVVARATSAASTSIEEAKPGEGDPVEALERVVNVSWEQLERHEAIRRAAAEELDPAAITRSHESAAHMLRKLIERGRRAGAFRKDLPVEWLVASCFSLLHTAADEVREKRLKPDNAMAAVETTVIELVTGQPRR
jgi:TetR/AcrR family transcriptional regulator, mexCD-oprJ operon repressor